MADQEISNLLANYSDSDISDTETDIICVVCRSSKLNHSQYGKMMKMSCCTSSLIHQECLARQYDQFKKCPLCSRNFTLLGSEAELVAAEAEPTNWKDGISNVLFNGGYFFGLHYLALIIGFIISWILYHHINNDNNWTWSNIYMMYFFSNLSVGIIRTFNLHMWNEEKDGMYFNGKNNIYQESSNWEKMECYWYLSGKFVFQYFFQCMVLFLAGGIFKDPVNIQWVGYALFSYFNFAHLIYQFYSSFSIDDMRNTIIYYPFNIVLTIFGLIYQFFTYFLVYQISQKISFGMGFQVWSYTALIFHSLYWIIFVGNMCAGSSYNLNDNNSIFPVFKSSGDIIYFRYLKNTYNLGNKSAGEWYIRIFFFMAIRSYTFHFTSYFLVTFLFYLGFSTIAAGILNLTWIISILVPLMSLIYHTGKPFKLQNRISIRGAQVYQASEPV